MCDEYAAAAVETRAADAARVGGGAMITEFGACSGSPTCIVEINRVTSLADRALQSWAYWQL